jgi:GTPase Era involved in 16S rRNA processing
MIGDVVPISALKNEMVDELRRPFWRTCRKRTTLFGRRTHRSTPRAGFDYPEKVLQSMGDEIPYVTAVVTEQFLKSARILLIAA